MAKIHSDIDYPESGPNDIYALGVPRDTPVSDRRPPKDLESVLNQLDTNFHNFGDYVAIVGRKRGVPDRILRFKGEKWRMDLCVPTNHVEKLTESDEELKKDTGQAAWWQNRLKQFDAQPVLICDGEHVYRYGLNRFGKETPHEWNVIRDPGTRWQAVSLRSTTFFVVDELAYPPIKPSATYELTLRNAIADEPAGTVVLEMKGDSPSNMYHQASYWLDPQFDYAVVKHELLGGKKNSNPYDPYPFPDLDMTSQLRQFSEFKKSPRGLWYPTVVRWKDAFAKKNADGGIERSDLTTYFYLDFDMEMPDEFFASPQ